MNAYQISLKTNLLRGTVKYRLRKLGYNTGKGIEYPATIVKEISGFVTDFGNRNTGKIDYTFEYEIFFYWLENKNNSAKEIAEHFLLPERKVNYILKRVFKKGYVTAESRLNYTELNKL